jgi:hypothetical protein
VVLVRNYLVCQLLLDNGGRSSLVEGLSLKAVKRIKYNPQTEIYSAVVDVHKTARTSGATFLQMDSDNYKLLQVYLHGVR